MAPPSLPVVATLLATALAAAAVALPVADHAADAAARSHHTYKLCVPEMYLPACQQMEALHSARLSCLAARDRMECIEKIAQHQADVMPVDPEDMFLSVGIDGDFTVLKEVRTTEEPQEEFRYEAVAVVHKAQEMSSVQDLRGLKSCHTGVGRNVGYNIPITKLTALGVLSPDGDSGLAAVATARERELRALSTLFSQACLVGRWSADNATDARLKNTYANLCALCERPHVCDYPDKYSGYDGALRCLSDGGGQVAWTKVYYVKKHFGIPIGGPLEVTNQTRYNPDDYAYLCPDGSKRPILGPACRWAARPWQGFMANGDITSDVADLRQQLSAAAAAGAAADAAWLGDVLTVIKGKTLLVDAPQPPLSPIQYLNKANYTDVLARGGEGASVRVCVRSRAELAKCTVLEVAAFARGVRPRVACVLREGAPHACLSALRDGDADIIALDAGEAHVARTQFDLRPILTELYGQHDAVYYAVAVVRKESAARSLADLRGARSCHTGYGRTAGWNVPLYTLRERGLVAAGEPCARAVGAFFAGGSCVPGAPEPSLCSACAGDIDAEGGPDVSSKCEASAREAFYGYAGAFRCLASGSGDVAFVKHATVIDNTDGKNSAPWAASLRSSDFELLCPDDTRKPVDQYLNCNLAEVPAHVVVTNPNKTDAEVEAIRHMVTTMGEFFNKRPDIFRLFGPFAGKNDLLFKDSATGFRAVTASLPAQDNYERMLQSLASCT